MIELTQDYPVAKSALWAEITEPTRLARWFGRYTGSGGTGGTVVLVITAEVDAGGVEDEPTTVDVLECTAPDRLSVRFPAGEDAWQLDVDLTALDTGSSRLTFRQPRPEGSDEADLVAGWRWYLDRLGASLAGTPMPDWSDYAPS